MAPGQTSLRRLFRERQFYLYSDGHVRTLVLSGRRQAQIAVAAVAASAVLVAGAGAAGAGAFALIAGPARSQVASQSPPHARQRAERRDLSELARTVQKRDAALGLLLKTLDPLVKPPGATAAKPTARQDRLLEQVRGEQGRLMAAAATAVRTRVSRLELAFRTAHLNPAAFAPPVRATGEGGPFIDAADPKALARFLDVDTPFAAGLSDTARSALTLRRLDSALDHVPFAEPVANPRESSPFGLRSDPFTGRPAFHPGQDFRGSYGDAVRATAAGVVAFTGQRTGYGNVVEVDHGSGLLTRYAHLSRFLVRRGQTVQTGQTIAAMGSTGRSTGVHLHYEVWQDGKLQNPERFLRAGQSVQQAQ